MGNLESQPINEKELIKYLRDGITMTDLVNLKKAFLSLDEDCDGLIEYDVRKITELDKYDLPVIQQNSKIKINECQFINIMIDNILSNRRTFGKDATSYESETSTVLCFICPFKQQ